jgi:hypothetical protein
MTLTALEMKRLDEDVRTMATDQCRGYIADAKRCLCDTDDPIAALELLRAMWSAGHAVRANQKAALQDAGQWLDDRLRREPALSSHRLELELGWLHRLITIHRVPRNGHDRDSWTPPREPAFGANIDALRRSRERALTRATAHDHAASPERPDDTSRAARPEHLPDCFEACFVSWQDAIEAFKTARKRIKQKKQPKDRLLPTKPVKVELQLLATDIVCSMLHTQGMDELQARATEGVTGLPSFWISIADLVAHDDQRLATRISFGAGRPANKGTP